MNPYDDLVPQAAAETANPYDDLINPYDDLVSASAGSSKTYQTSRAQYGNAVTERLIRAIHGQESEGSTEDLFGPETGHGKARGPMQIMPDTFRAFARPGEQIGNPADNLAVGRRIIEHYAQQYDNHPGRIAVAYYSGPGNVSRSGPFPWRRDVAPAVGPRVRVSEYVGQVMERFAR